MLYSRWTYSRILSSFFLIEIGQEKAQSVIDSITSSYAAEGQALPHPAMPPGAPGAYPPPFGYPGTFMERNKEGMRLRLTTSRSTRPDATASTVWSASWSSRSAGNATSYVSHFSQDHSFASSIVKD